MSHIFLPTTRDIQDVFAVTTARLGVQDGDVFDDGHRLFLRATWPETRDIVPGDSVRQGIAVRTFDKLLLVHPYVFRKVCSNGAIWAQSTDSFQVERVDFAASTERVEDVIESFQDAIAACHGGNSFPQALGEMRVAKSVQGDVDTLLNLMPTSAGSSMPGDIIAHILDRYAADADQSMFGLMNAVTSVARDTQDPELRWQLEELGGGVPAIVRPTPKPSDAAAESVLV